MAVPICRLLTDFGAPASSAPAEPPSAIETMELPAVDEPGAPSVVDEAYSRGQQAGREAAEAEYEERLAENRRLAAEELEAERERWASEQSDLLAVGFRDGLAEVEARLADSVGRLLAPVLEAAARDRVLQGLRDNVATIFAGEERVTIEVSGPSDLLAPLRQRLGECTPSVNFRETEAPQVQVVAGQTLIDADLQGWIDNLREALR